MATEKNNKNKRRTIVPRVKSAQFKTPATKLAVGRLQSVRFAADESAADDSHSQSDSESIRRRLSSIENNFELLDSQLDELEQQLKIEPLLAEQNAATDQSSVAPRKPR